MVAPVSQELVQVGETNQEQILREADMATQTMAAPSITQETTSKGTALRDGMAQVCWRVSFELEPLFRAVFAPFTARVRQCRSLTSREKAEFEALTQMR